MTETAIPLIAGPEIPPASGKVKQLVVFLHGYGADGNDLLSLSEELTDILPDAHFISPNAFERCEMSPLGFQWFSLQEWSMQSLYTGVRRAEPVLNAFLDHQLERLGLKDEDLILIGFSQGTMTALYTALRRANPCKAIVGFSGALIGGNLLKDEVKSRPPVCLIHGTEDQVVPHNALLDASHWLSENDVPVEAHSIEGLPHGIDGRALSAAVRFLDQLTTAS